VDASPSSRMSDLSRFTIKPDAPLKFSIIRRAFSSSRLFGIRGSDRQQMQVPQAVRNKGLVHLPASEFGLEALPAPVQIYMLPLGHLA
jgi:hypothetical protein